MKQFVIAILFLFFTVPPTASLCPRANAQWTWGRGNSAGLYDAYCTATDQAGNVWSGGTRYSGSPAVVFGSYSVVASTGSGQAIWVKYSNSGSVLWADGTICGGYPGGAYLYSLTTDTANNLIVYGGFTSGTLQVGGITLTNAYAGFITQYFLAKISPSGTVIWAKADGNSVTSFLTFYITNIMSVGGVTTDQAGNIYITSSFSEGDMSIGGVNYNNTVTAGGSYDVYVAKYAPNGTLAWATTFGGNQDDLGFGIAVSSTGFVYVTGAFRSPSMNVGSTLLTNTSMTPLGVTYHAFIARLSAATGVPAWAEAGGGTDAAYGVNLRADDVGNVYMTGSYNDNSIILGGATITRPYPGTAQPSLFLARYTPTGTVDWSKTIGSNVTTGSIYSASVWGFSIALSPCGQVWVSGGYYKPVNIDGSILPVVTDGKPNPDAVFIAGYNISGGTVAGYSGLSAGGALQENIACDPGGNIFISGHYLDSVITGTDTLRAATSFQHYGYTAKYGNVTGSTDTTTRRTDTTFCSATGITLTAPSGYAVYKWDNGSSLQTRTATSAGTYYVMSIKCGEPVVIDTFVLTYAPSDTTHKSTDTTICKAGTTLTLNATTGTAYNWQDGSTGASYTATTWGTYWVRSYAGCTLTIDSFLIKPKDFSFALDNADTVCPGIPGFIHITPGSGETVAAIHWLPTTGITDTNALHTEFQQWTPGHYKHYVTLENAAGCAATDSMEYTVRNAILLEIGPGNTTIGDGGEVQLTAYCDSPCHDNELIYFWIPDNGSLSNPNISNPIAHPADTTTYTIYAMDRYGCRDTASETIFVDHGDETLPTAFTPNDDGINDIFRLVNARYTKLVDFSIYDRWGERVYHNTTDASKGWNGTYKGQPMEMGVYFYMIIVERPNGKTNIYKGDVTLVR